MKRAQIYVHKNHHFIHRSIFPVAFLSRIDLTRTITGLSMYANILIQNTGSGYPLVTDTLTIRETELHPYSSGWAVICLAGQVTISDCVESMF